MSVRCAVIGSPIGHSLSPVLHRAAYDDLGLDWRYDAFEITVQTLPAFVSALQFSALGERWRGLSVTMPLKRAILPMLDEVSETVRLTSATNTVLREPDGRLLGHNTDVTGFCAALAERGVTPPRSALILGGGATASSVVAGLVRLGCRDVTVAVRDPARAVRVLDLTGTTVRLAHLADLSGRRDSELGGPVDLLVSTIPAAAQPSVDDLPEAGALFDAIYDPWPTPLARAFLEQQRAVVDGFELLVHQAVRQVELMTGRSPAPLAVMRTAGERALAERHG